MTSTLTKILLFFGFLFLIFGAVSYENPSMIPFSGISGEGIMIFGGVFLFLGILASLKN